MAAAKLYLSFYLPVSIYLLLISKVDHVAIIPMPSYSIDDDPVLDCPYEVPHKGRG
jgi:hypothetical protein